MCTPTPEGYRVYLQAHQQAVAELASIPFPDCTSMCPLIALLGVDECENVCPHKFIRCGKDVQ
ncbi:hypothetical protein HY491_01335 [Candidatus Woesearchaeota archaeon]|nr:hypothetical protein [Candidatus Woesearchaeota archaeon]